MGRKVAVVGGTGFLGCHLVEQLIEAGYSPVVVSRRPNRIRDVLPGLDVEAREGDLLIPSSLRRALRDCIYVQSLAGVMGGVFTSPNPDRREEAVRVNVDGTLNVLRAARDAGARRVVVTSSCTTRYQPGAAVATESSPLSGGKVIRDSYVRSKILQENAVSAFSRGTGLTVVSLLPGGMIGPRDTGPTPLGASLLARLNGDPHTRLSLDGAFPVVDVRDVARAHVAAMRVREPKPAYLVVGRTIPTRAWRGLFSRITGIPSDVRTVPSLIATPTALAYEALAWLRHSQAPFNRNAVRHLRHGQQFDCSLVRDHLGLSFTPLEATMRETVSWYAENGWITDEARLAIVKSALARAAYDASPMAVSRRRRAAHA